MLLKNSLSGKLEEFIPIDNDHVKMYVCGPTVYNSPHIGNTRSLVVFDLLFRLLRFKYPKVTYVRNVTDVDDKIINKAAELNIPIPELTKRVLEDFKNDTQMLQLLPPTHEPKATEHIQEMIEIIKNLLNGGYAYEAAGHVLFRISKDFFYGCLSKRKKEDMIPGKRINVSPYKENPLDFVLWKPAHPNDVGWDSPWGFGRPGWHIECSAMSHKFLGAHFDIHGGGHDLIFPHHENEITQSRYFCNNGLSANYWIHNGMLNIDGIKMSKSKQNVLFLKDILQTYSTNTIKYFFFSSHYSQQSSWNDTTLSQANNNIKTLSNALVGVEDVEQLLLKTNTDLQTLNKLNNHFIDKEFLENLQNDLNTPMALSRLHKIAKDILAETSITKKLELQYILKKSLNLIGLFLEEKSYTKAAILISDKEVEKLLLIRRDSKAAGDYTAADRIRKELSDNGIIVQDLPDGSASWHRQM